MPKRSLLSRLTDHYMQIIANKAPIGFEAEFVGQRGKNTMYRGILMPFSSTGEAIDFIYGVINWKEIADSATASAIAQQASTALAAAAQPGASPVWADGPNAEPLELDAPAGSVAGTSPSSISTPASPTASGSPATAPTPPAAPTSAAAPPSTGPSASPTISPSPPKRIAETYAELLDDAGLKAQARAPMTPVVKLVFGSGYDKAPPHRIRRRPELGAPPGLPAGGLRERLESEGLKALVQAERRARRPEPKPDTGEAAREVLRAARPLGHVDIPGEAEFVLLIARRDEVGGLAVLAPVADEAMLERAIRKAAA